ncbi:MAG: class B sortase [Firmicutes bacterium]|nr:class B sortase [Bacillota bacterium]
MKDKLRKAAIVLLTIIFIVSTSIFLIQLYQQHLASKAYDQAEQIALHADASGNQAAQLPEAVQPVMNLDLPLLQDVNADVMGWIYIPDTDISYPLMRSKDNKEYLKQTWDLTNSVAGSIFLDYENSADFSDFNTLIYGHNMKNGSMFSQLHDYQNQNFADQHPYVYIITEDKIMEYQIFSAYTADVFADTYRLVFEDDSIKQGAVDYYKDQSVIKSQVEPSIEDRILTLSTCTGRGNYKYRWVVQTVFVNEYNR